MLSCKQNNHKLILLSDMDMIFAFHRSQDIFYILLRIFLIKNSRNLEILYMIKY